MLAKLASLPGIGSWVTLAAWLPLSPRPSLLLLISRLLAASLMEGG